MINNIKSEKVGKAILTIAYSLRWGADLTIFPYDRHSGVIMLESHSMNVDDIKVRKNISPELLKANPEEGVHIINNLLNYIDQLEKQKS